MSSGGPSGSGAVGAPCGAALVPCTLDEIKRLSPSNMAAVLKELRLRPMRRPGLVYWCGMKLLTENRGVLGDDIWDVYEQVVVAALECNHLDKAEWCCEHLVKKFGKKSKRVLKLVGLLYEANDDNAKAVELYQSMLGDDSIDTFPVRRLSAMAKARGDLEEAVRLLETTLVYRSRDGSQYSYGELHVADEVAARELVNLNISLCKWDRALHYASECLIFNAVSYVHHTRYAEICYTMRQFDKAAKHYAQSVNINDGPNNARAVYGLWITTLELFKKGDTASKALHQWASAKLQVLYTGSPEAPRVQLMLQAKGL